VSLQYFVEKAFEHFGLPWQSHVEQDRGLLRHSDVRYGAADASLAAAKLGWRAAHDVDYVVENMCRAEAQRLGAFDRTAVRG
jgi:GDPmannose 4,6-dehydratase